MEMVLFSGIQAAGKSTFFKERFVDTHLRINPCSTSGALTGPLPSARRTMHSTDLEARMRQFEMALDNPVPPGFQIVARLDGRGFTRLTKEVCQFEALFDPGFRDLMAAACRHLMTCGFNVLLGRTRAGRTQSPHRGSHPDHAAGTAHRRTVTLEGRLRAGAWPPAGRPLLPRQGAGAPRRR